MKTRWFWPLGLLVVVAILVLAAAEAASTPPLMQKDYVLPPPWKGMHVTMDILVNGKPLPTVSWKGKTYLPVSNWGTPYQIRVSNHGPKRITAIASVDGVSVINLEPASEKRAGYLVSPHNSILIKGWRQNEANVTAFVFTSRAESFANKIGHPENVGVIGVVAFEELTHLSMPPLEKSKAGVAADSGGAKFAPGTGGVGNIGTGSGHTIYSPTYEVPFVRSTNKRMITVYYDSVEALREIGVPVEPTYPNPFPGNTKAPTEE
jgi:hypothetical protein